MSFANIFTKVFKNNHNNIDFRLKLRTLKKLMEILVGGGVFGLGNLGGKSGNPSSPRNPGGRGVKKILSSVGGRGCGFFLE